MRTVAATAPKDPALYYGAACLPSVRGLLWECRDRAEYLTMRAAYEAAEGNCNTCRHLSRVKHVRNPSGFLPGRCLRNGLGLTIHPDDPLHMPCWESRR